MSQYHGSRVSLTPASRLVLNIADIDNYRLLIDGLRLLCDFKNRYERLNAGLDAKVDGCNAILNSVSLQRFAHLMLQVGNILNKVACCLSADCPVVFDLHRHCFVLQQTEDQDSDKNSEK